MSKTLKYRSLRGMPDTVPEEAEKMRWVENISREVFHNFGLAEIRTSLLEGTEVFTRSIGEDTDIVEKEMYSFEDRGGKNISLRPEGTASIVRAYIENAWCNANDLVKLYYMGPMFRGERPQKGRLRQFHQIGAEMLGASDPYVDAELIISLDTLLKKLNMREFTILLNSLGCGSDREKYELALADYLSQRDDELCEDCRRRVKTNVLRVMDCKKKTCKEVVKDAPVILKHLCDSCAQGYNDLKGILSSMGVSFREKSDLVRGLDYYTGTIFEVVHPSLGAQDAVAAGGRYDDLVEQMGGPSVGAVGYAIGVERLLLAIDNKEVPKMAQEVFVVVVNSEARSEAFRVLNKFRLSGVSCDMDFSGRSFKGQMRKAGRDRRKFAVLIGEDELKTGKLLLKNLNNGEQDLLSLEDAVQKIKADKD